MTRHRTFPERALLIAGATALLSIALAGCKHGYSSQGDPAAGSAGELLAPSPIGGGTDFSRARSLYPLAIGNHWDYSIRTRNVITTDQGPQPPQMEESTLGVEIRGTVTFDELTYFRQFEFDPSQPFAQEFLVRGSRFGLFHRQGVAGGYVTTIGETPVDAEGAALEQYVERAVTDPGQRAAFRRAAADVAAKLAATRAVPGRLRQPPGAAPDEITLLSYPVYPGARWIVSEDPRFARIVVGLERIDVPFGTLAAWNLRGTSELYGPNDRVHFWYSNLGLVSIRYHFETDAVDDTGAVIGRVAGDVDQSLTGVHLVRAGTLAAGGE
jgi:hypothetical protein